jgi:hypothetical protein
MFLLLIRKHVVWSVWNRFCRRWQEGSLKHQCLPVILQGRLHFKCDGTRWRMGGEVKGKLANGVASQYPSHYLGTRYIQDYYRWCAHRGCQCAITFQLASTTPTSTWLLPRIAQVLPSKSHNTHCCGGKWMTGRRRRLIFYSLLFSTVSKISSSIIH